MKLFISYSRDDKAWVYELCRALRDEAFHEAWIDRQIVPASDWWGTILSKIEECDCFLYVLTPKSTESIYCTAEMNYAVALNKPLLPVMLKSCNFPAILSERRIQYQSITDEMNIDRVLLKIEQGLSEVRVGLLQGKYPPKTVPQPELPRPQQNPQHVFEVFALAEEAVTEANFSLAEKLFQQVMEADPANLGLAAKDRVDELRWAQDRSLAYTHVARLAKNAKLRKGARVAWKAFKANYGADYDPEELAAILDQRQTEKMDLPRQTDGSIEHPDPRNSHVTDDQQRWNVVLTAIGPMKIEIIKQVRELTSLGLKETKDLVEAAPSVVLANVSHEVAEKAQRELIGAGAQVTLTSIS